MTCSLTFSEYLLAVWAETPSTYIHAFRFFASLFYRSALLPIQEIGTWDHKVPCIRAQIELSSTLVSDCEISTDRRFLRGIRTSAWGTNDNDAYA